MRGVNASLPATRKIRVLLGDPPIEWEHVKTADDHRKWIEMRDTFPADPIQREVIAKTMGRFAIKDGKPDFSAQIPREQWKTLRADDQFDAVLYTGKGPSPRLDLDPARCAERAEFEEHLRRTAVSAVPPLEAERLKERFGL